MSDNVIPFPPSQTHPLVTGQRFDPVRDWREQHPIETALAVTEERIGWRIDDLAAVLADVRERLARLEGLSGPSRLRPRAGNHKSLTGWPNIPRSGKIRGPTMRSKRFK